MQIVAILLGALLAVGLLWLVPILLIIGSKKVSGTEKMAWILAIIFISWFAWVFFWLLAPLSKK